MAYRLEWSVRNAGLETDYLLHFQRAMSKLYEKKKILFFHSACGGKGSAGFALGIETEILFRWKKIVMESPSFRNAIRNKKFLNFNLNLFLFFV